MIVLKRFMFFFFRVLRFEKDEYIYILEMQSWIKFRLTKGFTLLPLMFRYDLKRKNESTIPSRNKVIIKKNYNEENG